MYFIIDWIASDIKFYLSKLKSYRRYVGGTWYRVFPRQFPYMSGFWIKKEDKLDNEIIIETETYGE